MDIVDQIQDQEQINRIEAQLLEEVTIEVQLQAEVLREVEASEVVVLLVVVVVVSEALEVVLQDHPRVEVAVEDNKPNTFFKFQII